MLCVSSLFISFPAAPISSSPRWIPPNMPPVQQRRCLMVTLITLPLISDSSIPRLDPLHPPLVLKRTISLETQNVHHHNHERTLILQRREYFRCHQAWRNPFYGTAINKADYMQEVDRCDLFRDRERRLQHRKAMKVFRDENKRLMEERWRDLALTRSHEALWERELPCLNPINWSGMLK
uniref:Uncharacterized protein n=1 Tax=Takifugu rubripes TaxID=31033 RepID=A0A674P3V7_TAKRU